MQAVLYITLTKSPAEHKAQSAKSNKSFGSIFWKLKRFEEEVGCYLVCVILGNVFIEQNSLDGRHCQSRGTTSITNGHTHIEQEDTIVRL